jgi:hypothetical protein
MLKRVAIIFTLWPSLASAQSYLVEPSLAQCQIRSAQQCASLNCDGGILQGSIAGNTLTITQTSKSPAGSPVLSGAGVSPGTKISGPCALANGVGSCPVNVSQTVSLEIMSFGQTSMWWACQVLSTATASGGAAGTGGTTAITIQPGTPYDVTTTNLIATSPTGLTGAEQAAIQTQTALGSALPWLWPQPTWKAIFTTQEITAINANATLKAEMTAILATNPINLQSAAVQTFLSGALAGGEITQATYNSATAYQATIGSP